MLIRIVRMTFQDDKVEDFLKVFKENKSLIRSFEGCLHLELMRDSNSPNILITFSKWDSEAHLNKYRFSELFKRTWEKTKIHFKDKPQAFSMEEFIKVDSFK